MPRISVVPFDSIIKVYSNTHHINDLEALGHLEDAYEHGMSKVIREIGYLEMLNYENQYEEGNYDDNLKRDEFKSFKHALNLCNTQEQKDALFEVEAELNHYVALESERHFIDGFTYGYKFLKKINHS